MVYIALTGATTSLAPDLDIARQQLGALDPNPEALYGFRAFDDHGNDPRLAVKAYGTLDHGIRQSKNPDKDGKPCHIARLLIYMQRLGAGVFFVPNALDGGGQLKRNVVSVRALYVDADSRPEVERLHAFIDGAGLTPTVRVASGGVHDGFPKEQCYWRMIGCPVAEFTTGQLTLISRLGTDRAVQDAGRVMRLAGFWHQKREPRQTGILSVNPAVEYDYRAFVARVLAQPQICDPWGGRTTRPTAARRGATTAPVVSGPRLRLRVLLDQYGGSFPAAIRVLMREAATPVEGSAGNRHETLRVAVARLVASQWADSDIRVLLLPLSDEWGDGDWTRHLDDLISWTRERQNEALAAMPAAPSALARAFNAGGAP